jgi:hypothetical protein
MAELIREFAGSVEDRDQKPYLARVYGDKRADGSWEGWLAFMELDSKKLVETGRETTQGSKQQLDQWAAGLEPAYLDGALQRAFEHENRISAA